MRQSAIVVVSLVLGASSWTLTSDAVAQSASIQQPSQTFIAQFAGDPQHTGRTSVRGPRTAPRVQWRFRVRRRIYASPTATQDHAMVFAGVDGMVHAVNAQGVEQWAHSLEGSVFSSAAISYGLTIVGHGTGFTALDSRGNSRWFVSSQEPADASPLVLGTVAYLAVRGITAVDIRDGSTRWTVTTPRLLAAPSMNHSGTILIVGDVEGNVHWIDAATGREQRAVATTSLIDTSVLVLDDDSIVVGSEDGHVRRYSPAGALQWNIALGGEIHSTPALARDGSILIGSDDYKLYALDPNTGAQRWNVRTGNFIRSSPRVDRDGWIYVGSEDDNVYGIEPNGHVAWTLMLGADVDSSPLLPFDGEMAIGCDDGGLYSLHE